MLVDLVGLKIIQVLYSLFFSPNYFNIFMVNCHTSLDVCSLGLSAVPIGHTTPKEEPCHPSGTNCHLENDISGFTFSFIDGAWKIRYFDFVLYFIEIEVIYCYYIISTLVCHNGH